MKFTNFNVRPLDVASLASGLEFLFTNEPGKVYLYQLGDDGQLMAISRKSNNKFRRSLVEWRLEEKNPRLVYFENFFDITKIFKERPVYLRVEFFREESISLGQALDMMMQGQHVRVKNIRTQISVDVTLHKKKDTGELVWRFSNGSQSPVSSSSFTADLFNEYIFFTTSRLTDVQYQKETV